ncbi:sulfurtransferase [Actinopolymorpha pittospori]|uniref:Thiosulfate/3-mercaptopyruvate sulfurtransferase n=1 Tax=Actinopolymorpha pittospori TaxID=648752 RepID=A0A927N3X5_9ACTN|nr:sulfurtransferase [Actinopolymorpha pittospori]MBE1610508.1 thiosulfate/3-mercaptopyruvate sulfurtransferase [Actinopolymorpha pittospori]
MSALVTAQDLVQLLDSPTPPVVLDVRWTLTGPPGREAYDAGHVPNARYVDLDTELADPTHTTGGGRHPLPEPDAFAAAMRRAGVNADSEVVVYGAPDGFGAARAWWCLRYFGHQAVRVLDGGYAAWVEAGLPVETTQPRPAPGDFVARPGGMPRLEVEEAARLARDGVLLDARAGERYRGEVEPMDPVAGHIPGAHNLPTAANLDENGRFRPAEELRDRFAAAGVDGGQEVGAYCGSGVSAAQEVLALELAGIPAALYVGSWSDWVSDRDRPVATGPDRG